MSIIGIEQNFRFSVITPTKFAETNRLNDLYNVIDDFKRQSYRNMEHLIVYDGYWPNDIELSKLIYVHQTKDGGTYWKGSRARNFAIEEYAHGEYIVFADDDDRFHPDYLKTFIDVGINGNNLGILQMRNNGMAIPTEKDLEDFPVRKTFGSPCIAIPRWFFTEHPNLRWKTDEAAGDYHLMKYIMETINPEIVFASKVMVSIRGGENPVF